MTLPSFIDMARVVEIGALVLIIMQYFKAGIPEKLIPVISILVGIAVSFAYNANIPFDQWTPNMIFVTILTGAIAAFGADTGYSFFSNSRSQAFTLPSKAQLNGKPKEEVKP
jgi:hypothetical protein